MMTDSTREYEDERIAHLRLRQADNKRRKWLERGNVPKRFFHGTVAAQLEEFVWPEECERTIEGWLRRLMAGDIVNTNSLVTTGVGMVIEGEPGVGKTCRAVKLALDIVTNAPTHGTGIFLAPAAKVHRAIYFTRFDALIRAMKATFSDDDESPLVVEAHDIVAGVEGDVPEKAIGVLFIDDLGKEYRTEWTQRVFENLLRNRFDRGLPTIITTNFPVDQWATFYGETVASFAHEALLHVPMLSPTGDRRRA